MDSTKLPSGKESTSANGNKKTTSPKSSSDKSMEPPKLPAGTVLDLSAPQHTFKDITFSIPTQLKVDSTKDVVISPASLAINDWITIAINTNLLHGWLMYKEGPTSAQSHVLNWKVPGNNDFFTSEQWRGDATIEVAYSDEKHSYVKSGFDTESASAGYTFCAASFERSKKEKDAKESETKSLFATAMWKYPRATIYLDQCTEVSKDFVDAIKNALQASDSEKIKALQEVFDTYGHVIAKEITLGGMLTFSEIKTDVARADQSQTEENLKGALSAKMGVISVSAGGAKGEGTNTSDSKQKSTDFQGFIALGGDTTLASTPSSWAATVKNPNNWAIIKKERVVSIIELLEEDLKNKVYEIWNNHWNKNQKDQWSIGDPKDLDWRDGESKVYHLEGGGFAAAMRNCTQDETLCSVQLISSGSNVTDPQDGQPGTATGAAYAHRAGPVFVECNSVCLPVPPKGTLKAGFRSLWPDKDPKGRLVFIPSNLTFGQWQPINEPGQNPVVPKEGLNNIKKEDDGFLFVSIRAKDNFYTETGDGEKQNTVVLGNIKVFVGENMVAGSSVHFEHSLEDRRWIKQQSLCVPIPKNSSFSLTVDSPKYTLGQVEIKTDLPVVHAYWIPLSKGDWKMGETEKILENTQITSPTDGILNGWIQSAPEQGARGTLKVYTGNDAEPCAAASCHWWTRDKEYINYGSVMYPVKGGTSFTVKLDASTDKRPTAGVYWTPIVPS